MGHNKECEQVREQISAFLDNELNSKDAVAMTHHLENCVPCHHEYERIKAVRTTLRALPLPAPALRESAKEHAFARLEQALLKEQAQPVRRSLVSRSFWRNLLSGPTLRPLAATMAQYRSGIQLLARSFTHIGDILAPFSIFPGRQMAGVSPRPARM